MNKYGIFHSTEVPYAYGKDKNTLTVKLRTAANDVKECKVYYKDRYDWTSEFDSKTMKLVAETDLFDYFEVDLQVKENRYRYYFKITDQEGNIVYFNERGIHDKKAKTMEPASFQFAYLAEADVYEEVNWSQEGVVYQIFPDRFCNGDKSNDPANVMPWGGKITPNNIFGGDLQGIIDKVEYLKDLGITMIYLTPIFKSTSNHKYNTADYYEIDPLFGDVEKSKELVEKCHKNGIKVIFDAVFNHSGNDFFAFQDVVKNGENSKYKDWYFIYNFPVDMEKCNYYTFANHVTTMPKLNTGNPEVKEYLLKVGEFWIKEVGIDGWRLDVCDEVDHEFWKAFRNTVKKAKRDAIIIGEIMHEANSFLKGDQLDSIMNYPFRGAVVDFFAKREINAKEFDSILSLNRTIYMDSITRQMFNLLGSHDTSRFLSDCNNDLSRMKLAIAFQFSYIGIPYIYYGDEIGLDGEGDPQCRKCMIWEEEKQNQELLNLYKTMMKIRNENKVLVYGDYVTHYTEDNVLAFTREDGKKKILVILNNNNEEYSLNNLDVAVRGFDILENRAIDLNKTLKLAPMEFKIIRF